VISYSVYIICESAYDAATGIALAKVKRLGYRSAVAVAVAVRTSDGDCVLTSSNSVIPSPVVVVVDVVVVYSGME